MSAFKDIFLVACRDAARLQSEAMDHPLPGSQRLGLRLHLLYCKWCRRYGRQLRFLRHTACDHGDKLADASPQTLSATAKSRIKEKMKSQ